MKKAYIGISAVLCIAAAACTNTEQFRVNGTIEGKPTIGFIAHMDTAPDASGKNVKARIVENYDGNDIVLNAEKNIVFEVAKYPEILDYKGQDIIVTDGTTLLGADDKAGIAIIVEAAYRLINDKKIKHGDVKIAFTPDEEVGRGTENFDVKYFNCDYAYTIDGGDINTIEYENFNAASANPWPGSLRTLIFLIIPLVSINSSRYTTPSIEFL